MEVPQRGSRLANVRYGNGPCVQLCPGALSNGDPMLSGRASRPAYNRSRNSARVTLPQGYGGQPRSLTKSERCLGKPLPTVHSELQSCRVFVFAPSHFCCQHHHLRPSCFQRHLTVIFTVTRLRLVIPIPKSDTMAAERLGSILKHLSPNSAVSKMCVFTWETCRQRSAKTATAPPRTPMILSSLWPSVPRCARPRRAASRTPLLST